MQAGALGSGGAILVFSMGTPMMIAGLARGLILLSGFEPEVDTFLEYSEIRPGENPFEQFASTARPRP